MHHKIESVVQIKPFTENLTPKGQKLNGIFEFNSIQFLRIN